MSRSESISLLHEVSKVAQQSAIIKIALFIFDVGVLSHKIINFVSDFQILGIFAL
jgi:hypothetical protein